MASEEHSLTPRPEYRFGAIAFYALLTNEIEGNGSTTCIQQVFQHCVLYILQADAAGTNHGKSCLHKEDQGSRNDQKKAMNIEGPLLLCVLVGIRNTLQQDGCIGIRILLDTVHEYVAAAAAASVDIHHDECIVLFYSGASNSKICHGSVDQQVVLPIGWTSLICLDETVDVCATMRYEKR